MLISEESAGLSSGNGMAGRRKTACARSRITRRAAKPAYRFFEAFDYPKLTIICGGVDTRPAAHAAAEALPRGETLARPFLVDGRCRNSGGRRSVRKGRNCSSG